MITKKTKFGIAAPHIFPDGKIDTKFIDYFVSMVEGLGYHSLWTQERVIGKPNAIHPTSFLAYLAGKTSKVKLGVSVLVLPRHNAVHLAKLMADIDCLSSGRLILGVGLGNNASELPAYGVDSVKRVSRFIEQVKIIKALWTEEEVTYNSQFHQLNGAMINPKPIQSPHPPIWFGANADKAIQRAVTLADGWMGAGSSALDDFPRKLKLLKETLASENRDPATFPISKRLYLAIDDNESRALSRLRDWFGYYYGNADNANKAAIWGSKNKIKELLHQWSELGTDEFLLNPVFDLEKHAEKLAEITELN
ncbi:MAG: LLM class flavin-dependent oxidoreductase [SAR202 cluster bacterium]|nr:LLM class flavin-dependent oxidoreductase [SAR202 cluster bacterium]